ncbi:MAG: phosphoserine phosphatase SerB [Pseudomonadales bacterium]|nr:phosphoserine phosphatase SerB [Pseudomonadales bacterium]
MNEIILINMSGQDKPGLSATLMKILADYDVNILDIGQAVIHDTLSLGILIEVPKGAGSAPVLKDILFCAHELDLVIRFTPIDTADYEAWVDLQGKKRFIVTLLSRRITAAKMEAVSKIISSYDLNIEDIKRLSGRVALDENYDESKACVEFIIRGELESSKEIRAEFMDISQRFDIDVAFQEDNIYRRNRRLVAFDMDSTLIDMEVIDELAIEAGVGDQVAKITELAMQGKIDFSESFSQRLGLLKGLDEKALEKIAARMSLTEGAEQLVHTLKKLGYKTAILSGGFNYFGKHLQQKLGIDYVFANELEVIDGKVTGEVSGQIVDGNRKAELLQQLATKEAISLDQVIAIGDGANDLPMLSIAGLGVAFRAKPLVKQSADHSISNLGLDAVLYLIGLRDRDEDLF